MLRKQYTPEPAKRFKGATVTAVGRRTGIPVDTEPSAASGIAGAVAARNPRATSGASAEGGPILQNHFYNKSKSGDNKESYNLVLVRYM